MGRDQIEAEDASIIDMNRAGGDGCFGGFRLALAVFGDDDQFGEPSVDVEMEVESSAGFTAAAANRPGDRGGRFEEGAVDGQDLTVQRSESAGGLSRPRFQNLVPEMVEDRLQQRGVGLLVEVGEGAFAKFLDAQVLLGLTRLAEIFERSERSQRGVEEGEEIGDKDVVEEEFAVAVGVLIVELVDDPFERADVLGPDDLLGPDGQFAPGPLLRPRAFRSAKMRPGL